MIAVMNNVFSLSARNKKILVIIGVLLLVCSAWASNHSTSESSDAQKIKEEAIVAVRGQLMPFDMDMTKDFTLDLGNSKEILSAQAIAEGFDVVNMIKFGQGWPFQIGFKDNKMSISANITNPNNETVGYIVNNTWKSASPNSMQIGDRSYNDYAFEILDLNMIPIFNIRVVGPNEIQIGGLFDVGIGSQVLISDNGGGIMVTPTEQEIKEFLVPIFKYPSDEYLGQLINPTYMSSSLTSTSDRMFADASFWMYSSYVFLFVGGVITTGLGIDYAHTRIKKSNDDPLQQPQNIPIPLYTRRASRRKNKRNRRKGHTKR